MVRLPPAHASTPALFAARTQPQLLDRVLPGWVGVGDGRDWGVGRGSGLGPAADGACARIRRPQTRRTRSRQASNPSRTCSSASPPNFSWKAAASSKATTASPTTLAAGTEVTSERW